MMLARPPIPATTVGAVQPGIQPSGISRFLNICRQVFSKLLCICHSHNVAAKLDFIPFYPCMLWKWFANFLISSNLLSFYRYNLLIFRLFYFFLCSNFHLLLVHFTFLKRIQVICLDNIRRPFMKFISSIAIRLLSYTS